MSHRSPFAAPLGSPSPLQPACDAAAAFAWAHSACLPACPPGRKFTAAVKGPAISTITPLPPSPFCWQPRVLTARRQDLFTGKKQTRERASRADCEEEIDGKGCFRKSKAGSQAARSQRAGAGFANNRRIRRGARFLSAAGGVSEAMLKEKHLKKKKKLA